MADRDTQFQGFAETLTKELDEQIGLATAWGIEHHVVENARIEENLLSRWKTLIAQRAYDLVSYTLRNTGPYMLDCLSLDEQIARIPDPETLPPEDVEIDLPLPEGMTEEEAEMAFLPPITDSELRTAEPLRPVSPLALPRQGTRERRTNLIHRTERETKR